jgi:hypothetical protein
MGEQAVAGCQPGLGGGKRAPAMDDLAGALDPPGVTRDRADEADLQVGRRVAGAGRQRRVDGATGGGVDQRRGEAAVDHADRVVMLIAGNRGEDDVSGLDLDELEAEQRGDRRRRELAGDHSAHRGQAVELRKAEGGLDRIVVDRRHAASRSGVGAGSGGWGRTGRGSCAGVIAASQGKSDSMVTSGPGMSCGVMVAAFVQGCVKKLSL